MSDPKPLSFVSTQSRTVHRGSSEDGTECGTIAQNGWVPVNADTEAEAVLDYNLKPCSKCIENSYELEQWRKDLHTAHVVPDAGTPDKWRRKYDPFFEEEA